MQSSAKTNFIYQISKLVDGQIDIFADSAKVCITIGEEACKISVQKLGDQKGEGLMYICNVSHGQRVEPHAPWMSNTRRGWILSSISTRHLA